MRCDPYQSALALRDAIRKRKVSPVEVMEETFKRTERLEPELNCFVSLMKDEATASARRAEEAVMKGEPQGVLHGLPISVKDLIAVKDVRLTFGSRLMANNIAGVDAPAVERIKAAGACIVGKTTTSEFGCKGTGDSPLTGITRNPWNSAKTPGGSSCGAAASVAAGLTPFAVGTDGGGSIRIPSAFTGLFGIKPQFGRVPFHPVAATPTLAHVGPIARTVRDAALLLSAMAGYDIRDPFSVSGPVPDFSGACGLPVAGMRLAWSPTLGYAKADPEILEIVEKAVRKFEELGCEVELVDEVFSTDPLELWLSEFYAGVYTRLKEDLANRPEMLDEAVASTLIRAKARSCEEYYTKVFQRYELRERVRVFFEKYDLLLTPTVPVAAFDTGLDAPPELPDRSLVSWSYYTYPFNLTGQPAASIPAGFTKEGLPAGLQVIAKPFLETDIFRAAAAYEEANPWAQHQPDRL